MIHNNNASTYTSPKITQLLLIGTNIELHIGLIWHLTCSLYCQPSQITCLKFFNPRKSVQKSGF